MKTLGAAILTYEGAAMREAHRLAASQYPHPLERVEASFRLVGDRLASDVIVRAGIRIAAEAASCFPERNIDPFRTWKAFVVGALEESVAEGEIRDGVRIEAAARVLVSAGMGTKDLLTFTNDWDSAGERLAEVASFVISGMRREANAHDSANSL
ncbi:hypothetical protein [Brevibacterium picturae]